MPRIFVVAVFVLSFCLARPVQQQPDKAQPASDSPSDVVLHEGQEVVLRSIEPIASNKSQAGENAQDALVLPAEQTLHEAKLGAAQRRERQLKRFRVVNECSLISTTNCPASRVCCKPFQTIIRERCH